MDIVIEARNLTKRYGKLVAVNGVSFDIERGEIFGLLGPNGAGKTTTVEMIEGLRKPDSGTIKVCGIDVSKGADRVKEIIGVQLQSTT
ncbi:MAG: ATP-binding cassette domain-containing protein [Chloroflexota bacterium]